MASRRERAIAPDVLIEVTDSDGQGLLAFVELDVGTMSHRRLRQKASGYGDYAKTGAWGDRHPFCPALLFLTTTEARARSFLAAMHKEAGKDSPLLTCACDLARSAAKIADGPRWLHDPESDHAVDLLAVLREARRPFDEERQREEAERREEAAERELLLTDPEALRDHLRRWWGSEPRLGNLNEVTAGALTITLGSTDPPAEAERRALLALSTMRPLRQALRRCLGEGQWRPLPLLRLLLPAALRPRRLRRRPAAGRRAGGGDPRSAPLGAGEGAGGPRGDRLSIRGA
jgi:hypothetical protein